MRKSDVERARRQTVSKINTDMLRAKVTKDLDVVRDAYALASQAVEQISYLLASVGSDEKPTRAMRELAAALRDTAQTIVALREEGRTTIKEAVAHAQTVAPLALSEAESRATPTPTDQPMTHTLELTEPEHKV